MSDEVSALKEELELAWRIIAEVDLTLRVPAAEYVPAIRDAFDIIDDGLIKSLRMRNGVCKHAQTLRPKATGWKP